MTQKGSSLLPGGTDLPQMPVRPLPPFLTPGLTPPVPSSRERATLILPSKASLTQLTKSFLTVNCSRHLRRGSLISSSSCLAFMRSGLM